MSVQLFTPATPTGLVRTTGLIPKTGDATFMWWAKAGHPTLGNFGTYFYWGDDPAVSYTRYVWIGHTDGGLIQFCLGAGTPLTIFSDPHTSGCHHLAYVREGSSHRLYIDAVLATSGTSDIANDGSFPAPTHRYLGTDTFPSDTIAEEFWGYREWTEALTVAEIQAEMEASGHAHYDSDTGFDASNDDGVPKVPTTGQPLTAVKTGSTLNADTPLFDTLDDFAGIGGTNDWTTLVSPAVFGTLPAIPKLEDPRHPGFAIRSVGAVATSSLATLTITPPASIVDGDLLLLVFTHTQGTEIDPTAEPAGFERVAHEVQVGGPVTGLTGEMFWKRASSEAGNYVVNFLAAEESCGFVVAYEGLSPDMVPVHVASVRQEPDGTRLGTDGITPFIEQGLLVISCHAGRNSSISSIGNDAGCAFADPNAIHFNHDHRFNYRRQDGGQGGGPTRCALADSIKVDAYSNTNEFDAFQSGTDGGVMIAAIFEPARVATHSGTKYYFGHAPSMQRMERGVTSGAWRGQHDGPQGGANLPEIRTTYLDQRKGAIGTRHDLDQVCNQDANFDINLWRGMTPPLVAQTIAGTIDLLWYIGQWWDDFTLGIVDLSVVHTKVKVYITKGQTSQVRAVLLDSTLDTADPWPFASAGIGSGIVQDLSAPFAFTSQTCEDGDSVMVELGLRVVSSPNPVPNYPPDEWTGINVEGIGGQEPGSSGSGSSTTHNAVPGLDAVDGASGAAAIAQLAHIIFSQDLIEKHLNGRVEYPLEDPQRLVPANQTFQTAIEVLPSDLPYTSPELNSAIATSRTRELWWKIIPDWDTVVDDEDGTDNGRERLWVNTYNTNHAVEIHLYRQNDQFGTTGDDIPAEVGPDRFAFLTLQGLGGAGVHRSREAKWYEVTKGHTYWARVRVEPSGAGSFSYSQGGAVVLTMVKERLPREGDVYVQGTHIQAFDECGNMVNGTTAFESSTPAGVMIDHTEEALHDIRDPNSFGANWTPTHNRARLIVGLFGLTNPLHEVVDLATLNKGTSEITWYADAYSNPDNEFTARMQMDHVQDSPTTARRGQMQGRRHLTFFFGNGFQHVQGDPPLPAFLNNVDEPGENQDHPRRTDIQNHDNRPTTLTVDAEVFDVDPEITAPHQGALSEDNRTLYHVSGGLYVPISQIGDGATGVETDLRATLIKVHDLETDTDLGDIGPIELYAGPNPGLKDIVILPADKGILVANGGKVDWLLYDGTKVRTYQPVYTYVEGEEPRETNDIISVAVAPDGEHFWCLDSQSCTLHKFGLFSTAQLLCVFTGQVQGNETQICVYMPNGFTPPCW